MEPLMCDCECTALRLRTASNGTGHVVRQCLACGRSVGSAVKMAQAILEAGGTPPAFDHALVTAWDDAVAERLADAREQEQDARSAVYEAYLRSPGWAMRRQAVMEREHGNCQGCRKRRAVDVHHLTYANVMAEFLFELVALCRQCHERVHGEARR